MEEITGHTIAQFRAQIAELKHQLFEANETIEAIRTGQVDALVLDAGAGHELYALKTADQTYRLFIEKMTEGAITLDKDGNILYSNTQFATMTKQALSSIIGTSLIQLLAGKDKSNEELMRRFYSNQEFKEETFLQSGDKIMPVLLSGSTVKEGAVVKLNIIVTDLSAQKESQQLLKDHIEALGETNAALEISNHDLQQFASVASHDLQEPLRKIHMFSSLVLQKCEPILSAELKQYLNKIDDAASRMKTLIIDILNYSKLSAPHVILEKINLNQVVTEILQDFDLLVAEKSAIITVTDMPEILGNRGQIRQALQNIISNGLKFSHKNQAPIITISGRRINNLSWDSPFADDGPYVLIRIKDQGIGFDEKYLTRIFTLFERLNPKDTFEGTGIGLAITKRIVEKNHGLITARSRSGDGSEFLIILPAAKK
jgi:PAS domain S-box-containing protein